MSIHVKALSPTTFEVTVQARTTTTHLVEVPTAYAQQLTGGHTDVATLVERSFEFLLEREPNTSILRRFDLAVIGHYFPEYERVIRGKLD